MNTTTDLDSYRAQLLQDISNVDNLEALESIRRAYRRAVNKLEKETPTSYTMEELNARIDQALDDAKSGKTYTCDEVYSMMESKYPWLCK